MLFIKNLSRDYCRNLAFGKSLHPELNSTIININENVEQEFIIFVQESVKFIVMIKTEFYMVARIIIFKDHETYLMIPKLISLF